MTDFPETQSTLLSQIKSLDDQEAWTHFVSLYRPVILRLAKRRGMQEADAEDLTQRVLVSVADSIDRWKKSNETVRFHHWLSRVAKNAIINALTRKPRDIASGSSTIQARLLEQADEEDSLKEIELEYRRELFSQAASIVEQEIEPTTWQAFHLTVMEGVGIEKAAGQLGKSVGSVYAARSRVMRRLKEAIQKLERNS